MNKLTFEYFIGNPPYNVYVADERGNNEYFLTTINSLETFRILTEDDFPILAENGDYLVIRHPMPSGISSFCLPDIFYGIQRIMIIIEDSSGIRIYKIIECTFNCQFLVYIVQN